MNRIRYATLPLVLFATLLLSCPVPGLARAAGKPVVLGAPLSTDYLYGRSAQRGILLAVDEINRAGGVAVGGEKRPFAVEVVNTRDLDPSTSIQQTLTAVEQLIFNKKADFIVGGPNRSEAALAAMPLFHQHKKISIVTSGVLTPQYHKMVKDNYDKFKYCFRIHGEAVNLIREIMNGLADLKARFGLSKIFIIAQDVSHARSAADVMEKVAGSKGFEVTGTRLMPSGTTDFSTALLQAISTGAQILNIWMDMPESAILLKQWYSLKIPVMPFGSTLAAAEQPGFWNATQGKGQYTLCNVVNAGNAPSSVTEWTMRFYQAYERKWGVAPEGFGASSSYMAVYVIKDAVERAGTLDADKVIGALERTDLMGVYGRIRFNRKSHQVIPSDDPQKGAVGSIFQWQNGKRVVVYPENIARGRVMLPPWMGNLSGQDFR